MYTSPIVIPLPEVKEINEEDGTVEIGLAYPFSPILDLDCEEENERDQCD